MTSYSKLEVGDKVVRDDGTKGVVKKARSCAESYLYVTTENHDWDIYLERWSKENDE